MDFMSTAQLLGNLGELVGAIAVVASIVYFGVHLRKAQFSMVDTFLSGVQLARLTANSLLLQHVGLVVDANSGAELDEVQRETPNRPHGSQLSAM